MILFSEVYEEQEQPLSKLLVKAVHHQIGIVA